MKQQNLFSLRNLSKDIPAGTVTFLVALPLCLGIALASGAPLFSGLLTGIVGGLVVGALSGSSTSVSGPAAGLTAVVAAQIAGLGSFEAFLFATMLAGVIQLALGLARAGSVASFFPSSVINGLLAAIGVLLILKQLPHLVGHDPDPIGEMSFEQPDHENTFTELFSAVGDIQPAALVIGLLSLAIMLGWDRIPALKRLGVPVPLVVVVTATVLGMVLSSSGGIWELGADHLVQVPIFDSTQGAGQLLTLPDFGVWNDPRLYVAAVTIAIVASLETLLNLEAIDNVDPKQRKSPPSRELVAQGVGNMLAGLVGGLPMTSVIIRSSVNVQAGNATKLSAIFHGLLLVMSVLLLPQVLNMIPLSALAAILLVTGFKLASPKLIRRMWKEGTPQFLPFAGTVLAIVATDLLIGIGIGLLLAIGFILHSNLRRPIRRILEKHADGDVLRIQLSEQVSFLNRAALEELLKSIKPGSRVLFDARESHYIDPDILHLIRDFIETGAPANDIEVSRLGLKEHYPQLKDDVQYVDFTSRDVQSKLTPAAVLKLLREGNQRFTTGQRISRDLLKQVYDTAGGQAPLAVVLSCIDSRVPTELVYDLGIGDIFSVRIAGNVAKDKVIGSIEYGCAVAGAKLVVVMGHTACGAVTAAVNSFGKSQSVGEATGCKHIDVLMDDIHESMDEKKAIPPEAEVSAHADFVDSVTRGHVVRTLESLAEKSPALRQLLESGQIGMVGALYDVKTGTVEFCRAIGPLEGAFEPLSTSGVRASATPLPRTPLAANS